MESVRRAHSASLVSSAKCWRMPYTTLSLVVPALPALQADLYSSGPHGSEVLHKKHHQGSLVFDGVMQKSVLQGHYHSIVLTQ